GLKYCAGLLEDQAVTEIAVPTAGAIESSSEHDENLRLPIEVRCGCGVGEQMLEVRPRFPHREELVTRGRVDIEAGLDAAAAVDSHVGVQRIATAAARVRTTDVHLVQRAHQ